MKHLKLNTTRIFLWIAPILFLLTSKYSFIAAQSITTIPTFTSNSGFGGLIFNFENTNNYPITIDAIETQGGSSLNVVYSLYYNLTPNNGAPTGSILNDPNWIEAHTQMSFYNTMNTPQELLNNINLEIPANTTVALAVLGFQGNNVNNLGSGHMRFYKIPSTDNLPIELSNAGCKLYFGDNISYAFNNINYPSYLNKRGFVGTIHFTSAYPSSCSGMPISQNIIGPTEVCEDNFFELSVPHAQEEGVSFQWQSSTVGQNNWLDINGAINNNIIFQNGITTETEYRVITTCNHSNLTDTSSTHSVSLTPGLDCHCIPLPPTNSTLYWIESVTTYGAINNISNLNTGFSTNGYGDFLGSHIITTFPGSSFNFEVQSQNGGLPGINIWIDWNQNGYFDSDELVYFSTEGAQDALNSYYYTIEVPSTAVLGTTRMRIRNYPNNFSCTQLNYGETEDYAVEVVIPTSCNGTPTLSPIIGITEICPSTTFSLHYDALPDGGIEYKWQQSPAGQNNWVNSWMPIMTPNLLVFNGITVDTDYRLIATCMNTNQADTIIHTVNITNLINCPCTDLYSDGCGTQSIDGVTTTLGVTNINNLGTGCNQLSVSGYTDFSADHSVSVAQSSPVDIQVDIVGINHAGVKVWVDWNQDGVFDYSELVTESPGLILQGYSHNGSFTVPSNALLGTTRMRVRSVAGNPNFDACNKVTKGETEDYEFIVLPDILCTGTPTITEINGVNTICPDYPFVLSFIPPIGSGIEYQWQTTPSYTNNWTDISGANHHEIEFPNGINTYTDYRVITTCTNSNLSDTITHTVQINTPNNCYCEPQYENNCFWGHTISNVTLAGETITLDNNSNCTPTGFTDYRGTVNEPDLLEGEQYELSITTTKLPAMFLDVIAWIDWNRNGVYEHDELIISSIGAAFSQEGTYTQNFGIPYNIYGGQYNMRVRLADNNGQSFGPCEYIVFGETEDYAVNILTLCSDPIVDLGADTTICEGESIVLDAGNPDLEFEWNNNSTNQTITVSESGTYYVTVSEGVCSTTATINVMVQEPPIIALDDIEYLCEGGSITLDAGDEGETYLWNDQSTDQTLEIDIPGIYSVTITNGVCSANASVEVMILPIPSATSIQILEKENCTITFAVNNPNFGDYFEWDFGDGNTSNDASPTHSYNEDGTYNVSVTVKNDCDDEVLLTGNISCIGVGIDDLDIDKNSIMIYPNPTSDLITITSTPHLEMESIAIYNIIGQKLYENTSINDTKQIINVSTFSSGVYTVKIQTNKGFTTKKFEIIK